MVRLTDKLLSLALIKAAEARTDAYCLEDGPSLYLKVFPNGTKVFQFQCELNGQHYIVDIGNYPFTSLSQARQKSKQYLRFIESEKNNLTLFFGDQESLTQILEATEAHLELEKSSAISNSRLYPKSSVALNKLSGIDQKSSPFILKLTLRFLDKTPLDDNNIGRLVSFLFVKFKLAILIFGKVILKIMRALARFFAYMTPIPADRYLHIFLMRVNVLFKYLIAKLIKLIALIYRYLQSKIGFF